MFFFFFTTVCVARRHTFPVVSSGLYTQVSMGKTSTCTFALPAAAKNDALARLPITAAAAPGGWPATRSPMHKSRSRPRGLPRAPARARTRKRRADSWRRAWSRCDARTVRDAACSRAERPTRQMPMKMRQRRTHSARRAREGEVPMIGAIAAFRIRPLARYIDSPTGREDRQVCCRRYLLVRLGHHCRRWR